MLNRLIPLLLFFAASTANSFEPSGSVWAQPGATFHVDIIGSSPSGGSWSSAFIRAMQNWTDQTTFQFDIIEELADPCIGRGGNEFGDLKTSTNFTATVCGDEYGENVLAVTLSTLTCQNTACSGTLTIDESDIVFNENKNWDIYTGPILPNTIDFERVALHELGHVIGLDHEAANDAIMQASLTDISTLQTDDINGANFVYGGEITIDSIYGIDIKLPEAAPLEGIVDTVNIAGALSLEDVIVDAAAIDIYQVTFANDINVTVELSSEDFDPLLYLARIDSTQFPINEFVFSDDNSGTESSSRIATALPAGTYWLGATAATANSVGNYSITLSTFATDTDPQFEEYQSIYGADVQVNPNPIIDGELRNSDFRFESRFLDLYQFSVQAQTSMRIDLTSNEFDSKLLLVEVLSDQSIGSLVLENDDNGFGSNSRIEETLQPGTYWIGVTSFTFNESGDYRINVTVNVN
ncbi:MAG: matrixin family metalloprotease [Pseudomonadales bacterium]|nr:matrixin family metalloprotease [Pseudomonadales bacterium]